MIDVDKILIQRGADTGRYHPAAYSLAPFPGPDPDTVHRFKSRMHHTAGFETEREAVVSAEGLAEQCFVDQSEFPVIDVVEAGPHIFVEEAS